MIRLPKSAVIAASFFVFGASASQAALISASGGLSSSGTGPTIIAAPADARDDAAYNTGIQAFNERQFYTLVSDLNVDGGVISAGTTVSSHMIFLNSGPGNDTTLIEHGAGQNTNAVTYGFDGDVLGVMSDYDGVLETSSSSFLGAAGTIYPGSVFNARGMEGDPLDGSRADDWYSFIGNSISLGMRVTEPGDWIRVITRSPSPIPVPASALLLGSALVGVGALSRRRKKRA